MYARWPGNNGRPTEAELIAGVRAGDRGAFEIVYRAFWPRLVAFARRSGAHSVYDAREIAQEVFVGIWRNRATWDTRSGLEASLFCAVRDRVDNSSAHSPMPNQLAATIHAIVQDMPLRSHDVYHLLHTEGLDVHTIAQMLGLSIVTVKRRHARALHLLVRGLAATEWADLVRRKIDSAPAPSRAHR